MATPPHRIEEKKQTPSPWGLMRLTSGGPLPMDLQTYEYTYDDNACGEGVTIYILGGMIQGTHVDFNYSKPVLYDESGKPDKSKYPNPRIRLPTIGKDKIDYGTFVAGIAAGSSSGVAKKATIAQVPMNDITKATSKILLDQKALKGKAYPAVVNISSGYVNTPEVTGSLVKLIKAGIHVVLAAGDDNKFLPKPGMDLEGEEQEYIKNVIWVGASTSKDTKWGDSNYGPGVDLFAPGEDITSATRSSDDIYSVTTHSGTAFAAPHVTGIIACLLSHPLYRDVSPEKMKNKILTMAQQDAINGDLLASCQLERWHPGYS